MDDINFENGYKAECVYNEARGNYAVRIYLHGIMVTAMPLEDPSDYEKVAKALMTGHINGMYAGKKAVITRLKDVLGEYI